ACMAEIKGFEGTCETLRPDGAAGARTSAAPVRTKKLPPRSGSSASAEKFVAVMARMVQTSLRRLGGMPPVKSLKCLDGAPSGYALELNEFGQEKKIMFQVRRMY